MNEDDLIVEFQQCQVKGFIEQDINGVNFYSFLGIPYAEPPIGPLRFKAPVAKVPWQGVLNATVVPPIAFATQTVPISPQNRALKLEEFGSEDCLYLNVFTKELPKTGKEPLKPVMVFIPGGSFVFSTETRELCDPKALITEDVVIVTIQYRTGCLGFMVFDDVDLGITGNAGLKDIVLALRWVQNNIKKFQGDPNNVTIFGQSAGGAYVHYLLLSPVTKGLFHKVIAQSGSCLATWATGRNKNSHLLAGVLDFKQKGERKLLAFLQSLTPSKLHEGQQKLQDTIFTDKQRYFWPVVEKPTPQAFLTEDPWQIISSGNYHKLPLMMGYTAREGIILIFLEENADNTNMLVAKNIVPYELGLRINSPEYQEMEERIKTFYNLRNIDKESIAPNNVVNLCTDLYFLKDISLAALLHSQKQDEPVYFYKMTADTRLNYFKYFARLDIQGACHTDDLGYLFTNVQIDVDPESIEYITRKRFLKLWTQFARTGNPNPRERDIIPIEWQPIQNNQFRYLDIGAELTAGVNPDNERVKFWYNIFKSNPLFAPYLENLYIQFGNLM